jgi:hypothetical protein
MPMVAVLVFAKRKLLRFCCCDSGWLLSKRHSPLVQITIYSTEAADSMDLKDNMPGRTFEAADAAKCNLALAGGATAGADAKLQLTSDGNILGFLVTAADGSGVVTPSGTQKKPTACSGEELSVTHNAVQNSQSIDVHIYTCFCILCIAYTLVCCCCF